LNSKIKDYILKHTQEEDMLLGNLSRETHLKMLNPRMLSGHYLGIFLTILIRMIKPKRVLEIGAFTGYSAICMAKGLDDNATLHTIDINDELKDFTEKYFQQSGQDDKIIFHIGDALNIIPEIDEVFDVVFIDADKTAYLDYYKLVFPKVRKNGFILADNALWDGKVVEKIDDTDKETAGIVAFNEYIQSDNRVENILLPIRDGLMVIWKK